MGFFRVKKSIKICPGIKINLSKKGLSSMTVGKSGSSVNISSKGTKGTVGIPGTGISYTTHLTGTKQKKIGKKFVSTGVSDSDSPKKKGCLYYLMVIMGITMLLPVIGSFSK